MGSMFCVYPLQHTEFW